MVMGFIVVFRGMVTVSKMKCVRIRAMSLKNWRVWRVCTKVSFWGSETLERITVM